MSFEPLEQRTPIAPSIVGVAESIDGIIKVSGGILGYTPEFGGKNRHIVVSNISRTEYSYRLIGVVGINIQLVRQAMICSVLLNGK